MIYSKTSEFFNSYVHDFDAIYGNNNTNLNLLINKYFRTSMKLRYIETINGCQPVEGKTAIDIGCGPGHYSVALAQKGIKSVVGIDFAQNMLDVAAKRAKEAGVEDKCSFICGDFFAFNFEEQFDYSVVMGVMDYINTPEVFIEKVLSLTRSKAFFSFPLDEGFLAWKRKIKYKKRCNLYMYKKTDVEKLFKSKQFEKIEYTKLARDLYVMVNM
ncbi:MAG: class I SAM-dependent methyltransferase [Cyanobacteriota bacterium]